MRFIAILAMYAALMGVPTRTPTPKPTPIPAKHDWLFKLTRDGAAPCDTSTQAYSGGGTYAMVEDGGEIALAPVCMLQCCSAGGVEVWWSAEHR